MTYTFKLSRRIARFRAPLFAALVLALAGCAGTDSLGPSDNSPPSVAHQGGDPALASYSFAGGIPFGTFRQPNSEFGSRYNGAMRNIWPEYLRGELGAIKSRGGKIVLMMAGPNSWYKDAAGHFSMSKWKARIDRYRTTDFSSYVNDGTIIAHYLIDEPNDPSNWNGQPIPPSTVEEMAKYSKQIWPNLPTIVRAFPDYMAQWSGNYVYLDAAWAQYVYRKGDVSGFIDSNVRLAKGKGLALIVGLNLLKGGPNGAPMTVSQVESWGSVLLSSSYPCAFISWQYESSYLSSTSMKAAMDKLRGKAENRATQRCGDSSAPPEPAPSPDPAPPPPPSADAGALSFGLFQAPMEEYSTRWTGGLYKASPSDLVTRLDRAASARLQLVVMLAGTAQSRNSDGTFSLTRWKAQVDRYRSLSLGRYVSGGTLYVHHLVDAPNCASCWGGKAIPWETVEEMARYSKTIWPTLATSARATPSELAAARFKWTYLDAGWGLYNTRKGDVSTWLAREAGVAKQEGLRLVAGLNLLNASGPGSAPMTATQIERFGSVLAKDASVCALLGWRYDAAYLSRSGIRDALGSVAAVARSRTTPSCIAG